MKPNKKITISILIIALLLILSNIAYAKPFTDAFSGGLLQINNFFANEQYKPYATTIDFFFFALLFISIYMMGARYAFKEVKRPEQTIVILLGLMTAFLLVLGGFSATILLPYIHWLFYILLFILYWWLLKGIKNKFWRFVLALLLTLLTITLFQGLFAALAPPEVKGVGTGIGAFFKSLGDAFKGIEFPGVTAPGVPQWLQDLYGAPTIAPTGPTTLPVTTPVAPSVAPTPERGFFGRNWWWLLLIPLLGGLGYLGYRYRDKIKWGKKEKPEEEARKVEEKLTIQKIIEEIGNYIKKKLDILNKINEIVARKKALNKLQRDLYYKALEFAGDKKDEFVYLLDPDSNAHKILEKHGEVIGQLLILELKLEKELKELMDIERELVGFIGRPLGMVGMSPFKHGKASRWIILLEGPFDEKRTKEIAEEIDRIEKLTPLLWREKFLDLVYRLLNVKEVPEWYKTRFKRITNLIDELIMTYQWDPQTMQLIKREPRLITNPDGTAAIARDDNGRIIWTYPSPTSMLARATGAVYQRWTINPDDLKVLKSTWFNDSPSICEVVMRYISYYLLLAREQDYKQKAWRKLIHPKELEKVLKNKDRWKAIKKLWKVAPKEEIPDILMKHFKEEDEFFNTRFKPAVYKELQHMYEIIRHLKYLTSEREETTMQELRIEYIDAAGEKKEYSEGQLDTQRHPNFVLPTIPRDKFIRVYTLLATGKGPTFKLACSVRTPPDNPQGGQFIRSNDLVRGTTNRYLPKTKTIEKTEAHPILEWKLEEFTDRFGDKLTDGEHEIYLYLVGPKPAETPQTPIAQSYRDLRSIRMRIGQAAPTQPIRINRPASNSQHEIGSYIEDLEAEFVSPDPNLNRQINTGGVAYMHFEWYVIQGQNTERIHLGRTGPRNFVSKPIPTTFFQGLPAKLRVSLYNADKKEYLAHAEIEIKLLPFTGPPPPSPRPIQLNIILDVDPPEAKDPTKGVEFGEFVTFSYNVVGEKGLVDLEIVNNLGGIVEARSQPASGIFRSRSYTLGKSIITLTATDITGKKGSASIEVYVKEKTTPPPEGGPLVPQKLRITPKMPFYIHPSFLKPGATYPFKQERGALPHTKTFGEMIGDYQPSPEDIKQKQWQEIEKEEIRQEITEFDAWFIREEIKAERSIKRGRMSEYKQRFLRILEAIEEEKKRVIKRVRKSEKASYNQAQVNYLLSQLDENIKQARKTYRFEFLNAAKDNIYELISLSSDVPLSVGYREGKTKEPYSRSKEKEMLRKGEGGTQPFGTAPDLNRKEWEEFQKGQPQGPLTYKPFAGLKSAQKEESKQQATIIPFPQKPATPKPEEEMGHIAQTILGAKKLPADKERKLRSIIG